ncbi:MAG: MmgE/PrpD family protein [Betaproteobacteria bacterium]|nr:MmgE/PrpD family protein [Betaproteobacteria bacterium]
MLGRAAAGLRFDSLLPEAARCAKQRILDTLGCLVAGYYAGISDAIRSYVLAQGGNPEATLLPGGQKTTAGLVGLAHATYIYGLELADAAPRGTVHPGCEIISIALAMAERDGLCGSALLPAVIAGYEVEIRFGRALHPHAFYKGWSTIGLLGAIGPAVTAGHLMGLGAEEMRKTLGTVISLLPAATGRVSQGGNVKWLVGGHACATGLLAAEMAARGVGGAPESVGIWLPVISENNHPDRLTEGIAADGTFTQWEILSGILTKYYATVGPLAAALDATFELIRRHDVRAGEVEEIHVDCMRRTALFNDPHPRSDHTARASLPHCVAVAVCTGDPAQLLGPAYGGDMLRDPAIRAMAERVRVTQNDEYERQYPARSLCRVTIRLSGGGVHSVEVDRSENSRYLNPTDADIEGKFRMIAEPVLGRKQSERVIAQVREIETLPDIRGLVDALRPLR